MAIIPHEQVNSGEDARFRLHLGEIFGVFTVALLTRIFVYPLHYLERSLATSKVFRRHTTSRSPSRGRSTRHNLLSTSVAASRPGSPQKARFIVTSTTDLPDHQSADQKLGRKSPSSSPSFHSGKSIAGSRSGISRSSQKSKSGLPKDQTLAPSKFGPTHFRSANIDRWLLETRSRKVMIKARFYTVILLAATLGLFIYIGVATEYWENKTLAIAVIIALTLTADAVLIDPLFTFVKCLVTFSFSQMINSPYVHAWNMDIKTSFHLPPNSWGSYMAGACSESYHPLLSSAIKKKRRLRKTAMIGLMSLVYLVVLVVAVNLFLELESKCFASRHAFKVMTLEAERASPQVKSHGNDQIPLIKVVDHRSATLYVANVYAGVRKTWRGGKEISSLVKFWDFSGYSMIGSLTKMITLYLSLNATRGVLPGEFRKIGGLQIERPWGYYTESTQETRSIVIATQNISYAVVSWTRLSGKTGRTYPTAGHPKDIRLWHDTQPESWGDGASQYYAVLRRAMDVIFSTTGIIIESVILKPRAVLIMRNAFVPNVHWLAVLDLVIEYLPEGICQGKLNVETMGIDDSSPWPKSLECFFVIILLLCNAVVICVVGLKTYFTNLIFVLKAVFLLFCFYSAFDEAYINDWKVSELANITDSSTPYVDIHGVRLVHEELEFFLVGLSLLVCAIDYAVVISYIFQYEKMARGFFRGFILGLEAIIMVSIIFGLFTLAMNKDDFRYEFPLLPRAYLKEFFDENDLMKRYRQRYFYMLCPILIFVVVAGYFKALAMFVGDELKLTETIEEFRIGQTGLVKVHWFSHWKKYLPAEPPRLPTPSESDTESLLTLASKIGERIDQKHGFLR